MPNPLDPLRRLATTTDLTTTSEDDLYKHDQKLRAVLDELPQVQREITRARQAIAAELHTNRRRSLAQIAEKYGVTRARVQQLLRGDTTNASRRRAQATKPAAEDDEQQP
jgi:DNA-directed RNA polymerase sigma subunit (sigma70/sigma32)